MKTKLTAIAFAAMAASLLAASSQAQTIRPMAVEFTYPAAGVTAPLLGGATKYTLRLGAGLPN